MQVLSVGEVLWDVFPHGEILGGAPLNFAANIVRLGGRANLISAVGADERGRRARKAIEALGVGSEFLRETAAAPTGTAVVSTSAEGEPEFHIQRPAAFDFVDLSKEEFDAAKGMRPDWLYFGTLLHTTARAERLTERLAGELPGIRCFYDMNLRPGAWSVELVQRLCGLASILKLNEFEARTLADLTGMGGASFSLEIFCQDWASRYRLENICVTLGAAGCLIYQDGRTHTVPGYPARIQDTVGAGDAFAAAYLHGFSSGWPVTETARFANALGSIVASRPGATPAWSLDEVLTLTARTSSP